MPRLPQLPSREIIARLEKAGFKIKRQRGSHATLHKQTAAGTVACVVPMHHDVSPGTLRSILRQAHITPEEFADLS